MTTENLEKIIIECGANLYDTDSVIENERKIFRVFITQEGGVSIDKCEQISRILSPIFDLNPPVEGEYFFEVSSPGIERTLKDIKHYKASIGEMVKIKLENHEKYRGKIISCGIDSFEIQIDDNEKKSFKYCEVIKARIYFEWK